MKTCNPWPSRIARFASATVFLIGSTVLLGWILDVPALKSVLPGLSKMTPLTATAMTFGGISLWFSSAKSGDDNRTRMREWILLSSGAFVTLIGMVRLGAYLTNTNLGLDLLGFGDSASGPTFVPARMSPATALGVLLCGCALLLRRSRFTRAFQACTLTTGQIAWLGFSHYLYGGDPLFPYSTMALHTTIALLLISAGLLASRSDVGLTKLLISDNAGGTIARRLVPAALLVPVTLGWLRLEGQRVGWFDLEAGIALFALSNVLVFGGIIWSTAALLYRSDAERKQAADALLESHEHMRSIFATALDGLITMDHKGRISEFNPAAEQIFGYSRKEVIGKPLGDVLIPPNLRAQHERGIARYLETGEHAILGRRIEMSGCRSDGSMIAVELSINRMPGAGPPQFAGFVRDISERQRAEAALRESEERFRTLAESLPQLVWTCLPDGYCDYLSRQWVEYTGQPEEEQLGYGWAEHLHPDDRERVQSEWSKATARGDYFDIEFRIRRADGVYRWFKTRAVPLRDLAGNIIKWFGSNTDFEDYKQSERRLQNQLDRHGLLNRITRAIDERQDLPSIFQVVVRTLEENLPVDFGCVCLYDPIAEVLTVTSIGSKRPSLALELGMTEQSQIPIDRNGLSRCVHGELVYEPNLSELNSSFPQRLAKHDLRSLVVAPLRAESKVFGVLIVAKSEAAAFSSPDCEFLRQLSEHVALAGHQAQIYTALEQAYEDLRRTQQAVLQQERLRALGQMASGVAHDINNALSPIALYTDLLLAKEPNLSQRVRDYLESTSRSIDDIAGTIGRMREFSRQREPQEALAPVNLNSLVQQVLELTRPRWNDMPQQRGFVIELLQDLRPGLPTIMGTEGEIRDALTNLIFNAVDAMPAGGTLLVRTRTNAAGEAASSPDIRVLLEVTDTGEGMDDETKRRCLEPFFTTKGERGTGLGLAMVYGMAQRQSADIEIESDIGKGTTVRLSFLARTAIDKETQPGTVSPAPTPRRILIIDDDPTLLKSLCEVLQSDGHTVDIADGGQKGIDKFRDAQQRGNPFEVVFTDLGMPYVDGQQVAGAIKESSPGTPVILLTGWGQRLVAEGETPAHVDCVLSKPPKLRDLRETLTRIRNLLPEE